MISGVIEQKRERERYEESRSKNEIEEKINAC